MANLLTVNTPISFYIYNTSCLSVQPQLKGLQTQPTLKSTVTVNQATSGERLAQEGDSELGAKPANRAENLNSAFTRRHLPSLRGSRSAPCFPRVLLSLPHHSRPSTFPRTRLSHLQPPSSPQDGRAALAAGCRLPS